MLCLKKECRNGTGQNGYIRRANQSAPFPVWKKCCCGLCSIGTGGRLVACGQICLSICIMLLTIFCYPGEHENPLIAYIFLITIFTHVSLSIVCSALIFLSFHFRRPWLLIFELVFLVFTILQYLISLVAFESYILKDCLAWMIGRTRCDPNEKGVPLCNPVSPEQWPRFEWWNVYLACIYLSASLIATWFFLVILRCHFYLRKKCENDKIRREKAAETMGRVGNGGGGLIGACTGREAASTSAYSRSTLTTSLTATTYDTSMKDPDLLLRY